MKKIFLTFALFCALGVGCTSSILPEQTPNVATIPPSTSSPVDDTAVLPWPLDDGAQRAKLLVFGLYVTPTSENNPIQPPERFSGYHTALDIEILPGEEESEVPVYAICEGVVLQARTVEGYGGTFIQSCALDGQEVTVLYGHLDPSHLTLKVGDKVDNGDLLGVLAPAHTPANGDNRKHLHLGIHRGTTVDIRGYVQNKNELNDWLDPLPLF